MNNIADNDITGIAEVKKVNLLPSHYVAIGASAGGLEAIEAFFEQMPPKTNLGFIVIQHLSPAHKSMMVELLSKRTEMPVHRAEDGMEVHRDSIYLIPPKKNMTIFHGKLFLSDHEENPRGINLPIDIFFRSAAEDQGEKTVGIILSGTGSDGTRGVRAIKENGGMVMVQGEETAKFDGMPRSAIATGLADFILSPNEMAKQLLLYVKHPFTVKSQRSETLVTEDDVYNKIFSKIREKTKVDFTYYKPSTVVRRIERRMMVNQVNDLREYSRLMDASPAEVTSLYRDLLIGVTSFFRDKDMFEALENRILPEFLENYSGKELRFWAAGCSTGEEAYSIAILFKEVLEKMNRNIDLKIFATDVDQEAIFRAGNGVYPESIVADVSPTLLAKYFTKNDENFVISRRIREMAVFAHHNIIKDPPFTNIDLISCRNLLIYLQPVLQRKVLEYFNFSLNSGGILILGSSETTGELTDFFEPVNSKWKIYKSKGKRKVTEISLDANVRITRDYPAVVNPAFPRAVQVSRFQEEKALERLLEASYDYLPLTILVNSAMEIIHIVGNADGYFRVPSGKMVNDIVKMIHPDLSIPIATGLQRVFRKKEEVRYSNVKMEIHHEIINIQIHIRPALEKREQDPLAVIFFIEKSEENKDISSKDHSGYDLGKEAELRIQDLEQELQFTKENLQATVEELETSNEELQATNEELLSSNEELQSTNEELQSVNEELHTVNSEYQNKIVELTELNYDIQNLLQTSQTAILFLDENLEVRRFTLKIKEIFNIIETDIGRAFKFISHSLQNVDLVSAAVNAAAKTEVFSKDVKSSDGKWYQLKIFPYQIAQNQFSGVLLHFTEITERIIHESKSNTFRDLFLLAESIGEMGYWEWSPDLDTFSSTDGLMRILEIGEGSTLDKYNDFISMIYPDDRSLFLQALDHAMKHSKTFDIRHRVLTSKGKILTVSQIVRLKSNQTEKHDHVCSLVKYEPDMKLEKFGLVTWR